MRKLRDTRDKHKERTFFISIDMLHSYRYLATSKICHIVAIENVTHRDDFSTS
jgi:hypothetical protein